MKKAEELRIRAIEANVVFFMGFTQGVSDRIDDLEKRIKQLEESQKEKKK